MITSIKHDEIIFNKEFTLKWRDLYKIRTGLLENLLKMDFSRQKADPIIIIISELLENAFKYIDKKRVTIILRNASENREYLSIKVHHPVSSFHSNNLKMLISAITTVNNCTDIDKLFLDSLREATMTNAKDELFRYALIRKTARSSHIYIKKSHIYFPGISISIPLYLNS